MVPKTTAAAKIACIPTIANMERKRTLFTNKWSDAPLFVGNEAAGLFALISATLKTLELLSISYRPN